MTLDGGLDLKNQYEPLSHLWGVFSNSTLQVVFCSHGIQERGVVKASPHLGPLQPG